MKFVLPSLPRSSYVSSSFWFILSRLFNCKNNEPKLLCMAKHFRYYFLRVEICDIFQCCFYIDEVVVIEVNILSKQRDEVSILSSTRNIEHENRMLL